MAMTQEQARQYLSQMDSQKGPSMTPDQATQLLSQMDSGSQESKPSSADSMSNILSHMMEAYSGLSGAKKGAMDVLSGVGKYGAKGIDAITGTNLQGKVPEYKPSESESQLSKFFPKSYTAGEVGGSILPATMLPGGKLKAAEGAISKAPEAYQGILRLLSSTGKGAGVGAAVAPAYDPDKDVLSAMEEGGAIGAAGPLAEKAIGYGLGAGQKGYEKLLKGLMGGTASENEIKTNITALKNIGVEDKMPIGHVVDSPHSKAASSLLAYVPGSGQAKDMINIGKSIEKKVTGVLDEMKPGDKESLSKTSMGFINDVKKGAEKESKISEKKYKTLEDRAKASGTNFNKNELYDASKSVSDEIKGTDLESDSHLSKIISNIEAKESSPIYGTRLKKSSSFGDALSLRKQINKSLSDTSFDDKQKKRYLMKFKSALDSDLTSSANQSGNEDILNLLKDANQHYMDKVVPLNSREISQFTKMGGDPDKFMQTFMKTGKYDRDNLLDGVVDYLSPENKGKFAHAFLNKSSKNVLGEEKSNKGKIINEYMGMSDNAKNKLFTPSQKETMDSAHVVKKMAGGDLHQLVNPKTGNVWAKMAGMAGSAAVAPPIVANLAVKLLKNPKTRDQYVKALNTGKIQGKNVDLSEVTKLIVPYLMSSQQRPEGQNNAK